MKWFCAGVLCLFALSAQAATWYLNSTLVNLPGTPYPPFSVTGSFEEHAGQVSFWNFFGGPFEFNSAAGNRACEVAYSGQPWFQGCQESVQFHSPSVYAFYVVFGGFPSTSWHLILYLDAPLDSGADTIALDPHYSAIGFGGQNLSVLIGGYVTSIPEPETMTATILGLALMIYLHIGQRVIRGDQHA